jgi:hypothetical protein
VPALLGLVGIAVSELVLGWLVPALIALSILLLGRSFYILYVQKRGNRLSVVLTWMSAGFVIGYWTWRLIDGSGCAGSPSLPY